MFAGPFLEFEAEPILFHLEDREVVFLHQIDDRFDVFEFQKALPFRVGRTLGKAVLNAGSSRRFGRGGREMRAPIIENPFQLRPDEEGIEDGSEGPERGHIGDEIVHLRSGAGQSAEYLASAARRRRTAPLAASTASTAPRPCRSPAT